MKQWFKAHRVELLLFLLLWTTYAYFYQSTQDNEAARFDQIRTLVEDRTLAINKHWWNTADLIRYQKQGTDRIYPNKAPGASLLGVVPYAIITAILSPLCAAGLPVWIYWHLVTYLTIVFTVSLLSALAGVAIYRLLVRMTKDHYFSVLIVLAIWLGTLAFPFSTLFFSHQIAAALLVFAFCLLFTVKGDPPASARGPVIKMGIAGLLMGLSITTEYPTTLLVCLLSIYAVWVTTRHELSLKWRAILLGACALGLLAGVGVLVTYNIAAFGRIFYVPYEAYAKPGAFFNATYSKGWMGLHWLGFRHLLHALASITIYPTLGLLYIGVQGWRIYACNPVLWLSLPGLAVMIWKREWRSEGLLIAAMALVYLLFIANYGSSIYDWSGASYLGPRHIIPLLPFLALPLYFGARKLRFVFYPLFAISVFYMLLATAIEPRIPFPFEIPARDLLLPDYLRGKLAQNTRDLFDPAHHILTKDSTAFNLAKAAGIPGAYQLAPLMLWWLIAGGTLMFVSARLNSAALEPVAETTVRSPYSPKSAAIVLALFTSAIALAPIVHRAIISSGNKEHGLLGKYYRNKDWAGEPIDVQVDPTINFDWSKSLPLPPPFSVEWTGNVLIENPGNYIFALVADDGALLEIDGKMAVDVTHALLQERSSVIHLTGGLHSIRVRYFNVMFGGSVKLSWTETGRPKQIVPREVLLPAPQVSQQRR